MVKQVNVEVSPVEKIDDSRLRFTETKTTVEEVTHDYTLADLKNKKASLQKAIADTESARDAKIAESNNTIVILQQQSDAIDAKIAEAQALGLKDDKPA